MKELAEKIMRWRRDLHEIPEIGNDLPKTSLYVQNCLRDMGISFYTMLNGSAVVGTIEGSTPGKTVALRADMDALVIKEEAPIDFKAKNGLMHACGHDAHAAMLLGAAEILNEKKNLIKGRIKLIFQPGEENPGGALPMIEHGALEGVDAIFGQHIGCLFSNLKPEDTGKIVVSTGNVMSSRSSFKITIRGKGSHSSMPHLAVDPVAIAAQIINGIYMIKAREIDALWPFVISICMVHGGNAPNIMPETVELQGSTRTFDGELTNKVKRRIEEIVQYNCMAYGATYDYEFIKEYPALKNDTKMANLVIKSAKKMINEENIIIQREPLMCSEDMSYYLNKIPGAYFFLLSVVEQNGIVYGHHTPKFMIDETVLFQGSSLLSQIAMDFLNLN